MLGHRTLTLDDYGAILKRRGWMIAIPVVILPLIALALTFVVAPQYVSQTLILIEQQKVPDDYVRPVVSEDITARLASMKEQILSRSRLIPIIERFNLYGTKSVSMDDRVDQTRKNIDIKAIHSEMARTGGLPGFYISFKAADARTAQQVCGEITSLFVSENLKARAASVDGTTDFLKSQLADAKRSLDEQDAKLAKFQQAYAGKLPDETGTNMNMLGSVNTQLDVTNQALLRMEQDRVYQEAMLTAQQSQTAQANDRGMGPGAQQVELQQLLAQEADLTGRYTEDYPDVVAIRRKIKDLRQEIAKAPAPTSTPAPVSSAPSRADSLTVQQMRAQLRSLDQGIAQKKHEQAILSNQLHIYQDRVSSSPSVNEEYKTLTRDYQTAQAFYDDLLRKLNQSKMATDLERRQQGEQFRMMDEANLPESPSFPKRGMFLGAGLAAGLFLGLAIVAWAEYRDPALRSERDIWAFTKLPTLGVIGFSSDTLQTPTKRKWTFGRRRPVVATTGKPLMNAGG